MQNEKVANGLRRLLHDRAVALQEHHHADAKANGKSLFAMKAKGT
jgi:hypothetical protein